MFAMGFTQGATQEGSPAKRAARQEDRQTCLPVTIRIVESALEKSGGASEELQIHGVEHGMLVLVALVESVTRQTANLELALNDGTGRVKARYYLTDRQPKDFDEIAPGRFLSAFGNMRTSPAPHFVMTGMRLVETADEISYHMIECAHAALKLQHDTSGLATPSPKKVADVAAHATPPPVAQASVPIAQTTGELSKPQSRLEGSALRDAILACLRQQADSHPEGSALSSIFVHMTPTPEADVRKVVEQLVDGGDVFTTIDDEHFSAV